MPKPLTIRNEIEEGDDLWTLARPTGPDAQVLFATDVDTFDFALYRARKSSGTLTAEFSGSGVSPSGVMFASLQVDGWWEEDSIGYTFRHGILRSTLDSNSVTMQGGQVWFIDYRLNVNISTATQVAFRNIIVVLSKRL